MKKITIIGAGIGGLTTAIALEQKGFEVEIYEQAKQIKMVGAGILLASNAMQVYEKLGLRTIIENNGNPVSSLNLTKPNLQVLSKVSLTYFEQKYKVQNIAIHRAALQELLIDALQQTEIHLGHRLQQIKKTKDGYTLSFENGIQKHADIVIAADGLHSKVRKQLFKQNTIRNAKQICWRGISSFPIPSTYKKEVNEAWGNADRFGFVEIAKDKIYWFALKRYNKTASEYTIEDIEKYFSGYHPLIQKIITSTPKDQINTAEIADLKPISDWYQDGLCLIGDAAHATTPNLGQGACQAIEDAYMIANCLDKYEVNNAFSHFQKIRLPKTHRIINTSWQIGKMAHLSNPILRFLRDTTLRLTPNSISKKQTDQIFQLEQL